MQKYIERMITERDDLKGKILRAKKAIENPPYGSDKEGLEMLSKQVEIMDQYFDILSKRINYEVLKCGKQ